MKTCTKCRESKEFSEFNKQPTGKNGLKSKCKNCEKQYHIINKERNNANSISYYNNNKEKIAIKSKTYNNKHIEKRRITASTWNKNNPQRVADNNKTWNQLNSGKKNAASNKREAAKLQRTPKWLTIEDFKQIEAIYRLSSTIQKITGIEYNVDHIIPLQGETVSGFHIVSNLRIITAEENKKKGNKFN